MKFFEQLFCQHEWKEIRAKIFSILLGEREVDALECIKCYKIRQI